MRYSYYVQIRRMGETLKEAADYLQGCNDGEEQQMLLRNCRDMARAVQKVTSEDRDAREATTLLRRIRQSCDLALENFRFDEIRSKNIEAFIQAAEPLCDVIEQIPYKIKVVFLAELGEKWDSLHSVYKAFKERVDCETTVVLTPVFRVVQQNSKQKQEVIYRDYLTPLNIPFIDYRKYNMKKDCPDIVFMTQPYESCSLPEFWPETIAKFSRLVYIPYYTSSVSHKDSEKTWCNLPVHEIAWRIIGQSDKMHDYFKRHALKQGRNVLTLGLPMWDEILNVKNNGLRENARNLPFEVNKNARKVILWCSHYDYTSSSLKFAKQIVSFFTERKELILIWRKHPMTDTVLRLYYPPEIEKEMISCFKIVEESENMMMDTDPLFTTSFYYSDGMISDFSSMIPQYLLMDKPALWLYNSSWKLSEQVLRNDWVITANSIDDIAQFCNDVVSGKDRNKQLRNKIIREDIPLADGECGHRVCNCIIQEMLTEDNLKKHKE